MALLATALYGQLTAHTGGRAQTASPVGLGDPNRCLGVLFSCDEVLDAEHAFFAPLVEGIRARALERNADLFSCHPRRGSPIGADAESVERCLRRGVDGIVMVGFAGDDEVALAAGSSRVPTVFVESDAVGRGARLVGIDNVEAMRSVVRHLAGLGYRRIAHIAGLASTAPGRERAEGYRLELERQGLPFVPDYLQEGDFYPLSGHEAMERLLALPEPPDAVAAASDMQAIGALAALEKAGLRCPEDVAVTGFDDAPYAADVVPSLTTVNQLPHSLGADAVDALIEMIVFPRKSLPTILRGGELVVRDSCGAR